MRMLFVFVAVSAYVLAQIPTSNLVVQYDMTTISGGVLMDQSGNGNNATLHGTTDTAKGVTFNGTSDYISLPQVIGAGNFTTLICSTYGNGGYMWAENDSSGYGYGMNTVGNGANRILFSNSLGGTFNTSAPASVSSSSSTVPTYHCYFLSRNGHTGAWGIVDTITSQTIDVGTGGTVTPDAASLGARVLATVPGGYWSGSIAYFVLWTRALSADEMSGSYSTVRTALASRSVFVPDIHAVQGNPGVWTRHGMMIYKTTETVVGEPKAMWDANCQIVSSPCMKLWYNGGSSIWYAESQDGKTNWQKHGMVLNNYIRPSVPVKVGGNYVMLVRAASTPRIDAFTSPITDGLTWTLAKTGAIALGSGGSWDDTNIDNTSSLLSGGTCYTIYEASGTGSNSYQIGGGTSTDCINITKSSANPLNGTTTILGNSGVSGLYKDASGSFWEWSWAGASKSTPYRWTSSTFNSQWIQSPYGRATFNNGPPDESGQVSDMSFTVANGQVYMYYQAAEPGAGPAYTIKLATAQGTIADLLQGIEGSIGDYP